MVNNIEDLLSKLKFHGIESILNRTLKTAQEEQLAISDVIYQLLFAEYQDRKERALLNRMRAAKLPWQWTLDTFPFKEQPGVNKSEIMELAKLNFIEKNENIIFIGEPGTGKTGLAIGLLRTAILNGHRGKFYNAQDLLDELYTSLADRTTAKLYKQLSNIDVLCIDELGYLTLNKEQVNMFFKLIEMRYQKRPTIITTNLTFEKWYDIFHNKALVTAMLDRYQHYCTAIHIEGESLRVPKNNIEKPNSKKMTSKEKQNPETSESR